MFNLEEFICLLNMGDFLITPDSGVMHMSFLSKINVVPIFTVIKPYLRIPQYLFSRVYPIYIPDLIDFPVHNFLPRGSYYAEKERKKAVLYSKLLSENFYKLKDRILEKIEEIIFRGLIESCAE